MPQDLPAAYMRVASRPRPTGDPVLDDPVAPIERMVADEFIRAGRALLRASGYRPGGRRRWFGSASPDDAEAARRALTRIAIRWLRHTGCAETPAAASPPCGPLDHDEPGSYADTVGDDCRRPSADRTYS